MAPHRGGSPRACRDEAALTLTEVIDGLRTERRLITSEAHRAIRDAGARIRMIDHAITALTRAHTELGEADRMDATYAAQAAAA